MRWAHATFLAITVASKVHGTGCIISGSQTGKSGNVAFADQGNRNTVDDVSSITWCLFSPQESASHEEF